MASKATSDSVIQPCVCASVKKVNGPNAVCLYCKQKIQEAARASGKLVQQPNSSLDQFILPPPTHLVEYENCVHNDRSKALKELVFNAQLKIARQLGLSSLLIQKVHGGFSRPWNPTLPLAGYLEVSAVTHVDIDIHDLRNNKVYHKASRELVERLQPTLPYFEDLVRSLSIFAVFYTSFLLHEFLTHIRRHVTGDITAEQMEFLEEQYKIYQAAYVRDHVEAPDECEAPGTYHRHIELLLGEFKTRVKPKKEVKMDPINVKPEEAIQGAKSNIVSCGAGSIVDIKPEPPSKLESGLLSGVKAQPSINLKPGLSSGSKLEPSSISKPSRPTLDATSFTSPTIHGKIVSTVLCVPALPSDHATMSESPNSSSYTRYAIHPGYCGLVTSDRVSGVTAKSTTPTYVPSQVFAVAPFVPFDTAVESSVANTKSCAAISDTAATGLNDNEIARLAKEILEATYSATTGNLSTAPVTKRKRTRSKKKKKKKKNKGKGIADDAAAADPSQSSSSGIQADHSYNDEDVNNQVSSENLVAIWETFVDTMSGGDSGLLALREMLSAQIVKTRDALRAFDPKIDEDQNLDQAVIKRAERVVKGEKVEYARLASKENLLRDAEGDFDYEKAFAAMDELDAQKAEIWKWVRKSKLDE